MKSDLGNGFVLGRVFLGFHWLDRPADDIIICKRVVRGYGYNVPSCSLAVMAVILLVFERECIIIVV